MKLFLKERIGENRRDFISSSLTEFRREVLSTTLRLTWPAAGESGAPPVKLDLVFKMPPGARLSTPELSSRRSLAWFAARNFLGTLRTPSSVIIF